MKIGRNKSNLCRLGSLLILLLVIFTACQTEQVPTKIVAVTQSVPITPTTTASPVKTDEAVVVTDIPTPTATSISLIETPDPFPIPTLSLEERKAVASELYQTNANCKLPCWWGFVPGKTEWRTAESFLRTIATEISIGAESDTDLYYSVRVSLPVPQELSKREELEQRYIIDDGKIALIDSEAPRARNSINTFSDILNTYSRPAEVKIDTYGYAHEGPNPFRVALFYPDKGILVRYGTYADFIDEYVVGCLQAGTGSVVVWSPEQELSFAEALNGARGLGTFGEQYYKPLKEATEMNIEMFYQTYLDPDTETCIETPTELWMDR